MSIRTKLDSYRFGGYAGLFYSLSKESAPRRDLGRVLYNSFPPGEHGVIIKSVKKSREYLSLVLSDGTYEHREQLPLMFRGERSWKLNYLLRAAGVTDYLRLPGRELGVDLRPTPGYTLSKEGELYVLTHDGMEYTSDNVDELLDYAAENKWEASGLKIARFIKTR